MAKTVPCYINSYKLQLALSFGEFGWSADAPIVFIYTYRFFKMRIVLLPNLSTKAGRTDVHVAP